MLVAEQSTCNFWGSVYLILLHFSGKLFWGQEAQQLGKNLKVQIDLDWVAVKELKISDHNGYI